MRPQHWLYSIPLRLRFLFRRHHVEQELNEELQFHLERKIEEGIASGLSAKQARYVAMRAIDALEQRKEEMRDMRRIHWLTDFLDDDARASRSGACAARPESPTDRQKNFFEDRDGRELNVSARQTISSQMQFQPTTRSRLGIHRVCRSRIECQREARVSKRTQLPGDRHVTALFKVFCLYAGWPPQQLGIIYTLEARAFDHDAAHL
jgi:hypothetical protein